MMGRFTPKLGLWWVADEAAKVPKNDDGFKREAIVIDASGATARRRGQIVPRGEGVWLVRVFWGRDEHGKRRHVSRTIRGSRQTAEEAAAAFQRLRRLGFGPRDALRQFVSEAYTYVILNPMSKKVKIGKTGRRDVWRRLIEIQTAAGCPLQLLGILAIPEAEAHRQMRSDRYFGEWFNVSVEMKQFLTQHLRSVPAGTALLG